MFETTAAAHHLSRRRQIAVVAALFLALFAAAPTQAGDIHPMLRDVANAYGMRDFHTVEKVVFTFNVKRGDDFISRTWVWRPQSTELMYVGPNESGSLVRSAFFRNELNDASPAFHHQVDKWFINDSFWLLFPMMAAWDSSVTVTDGGSQPMPLGGGSARKLTVQYPTTDGRTGDAYVLYLDGAHRIRQWAYHASGAAQPSLVTSWDENTRMGPLLISMSRQDANGAFKLWFSNVVITSRHDRGGDIPTVSEFTAQRYRAHSELAMDYRRQQRAEQLAAKTEAEQNAATLAEREAEARRQAELAAARQAELDRQAQALAANQNQGTPQETPEQAAERRRQAELAAAENRRQAEIAAANTRRAQEEADRLAMERERADDLARREAEERRRQAQLAEQRRTEVRQTEATVKPTPASSNPRSTMVAGMDTEIDPDITVRKDGGIMVQGVIHTADDLGAYLKAVSKRDRDAPVTIRLDRRYDAATYVVVMNMLRENRLKNLVVVNSR